jgi:hypothetical protein
MFMDYITYQGVLQVVAKQLMLQDLECHFCKSHSSLEKFGFLTPDGVPTELEEAISLFMSPDVLARHTRTSSISLTGILTIVGEQIEGVRTQHQPIWRYYGFLCEIE